MNLNTIIRQLDAQLDEAEQGMVPDDLEAKGWRYQNFPGKFTPKAWDYLLAWIGDGEYQLVISFQGRDAGGLWKRGQFFISPQGFTNLKDRERGLKLAEEMRL